jgi:RNA polymerase sigma-70 factor (ECF subfamily)
MHGPVDSVEQTPPRATITRVSPPDEGNPERPTFEHAAAVGRACLPPILLKLGVRRQDVDDVVHETLIEVGRALPRYDPEHRGGRRDPAAALRSWLWGFACRAAAAYRRHMRREIGESLDALADEPPAEGPSSEQLAANEQRRRVLAEVLSKLPPPDAEVMVPFHFAGMTTDEIAAAAGVHPGTMRGRLMRARERFRAAVEALPEDQRSLLEDGLLLVPVGLALDGLDGDAEPPPTRGPSAPAIAAGAIAVLALGIGLGATWTRRGPREAPELPAVIAVRETPTPAAVEATASAASPPAPEAAPRSPASVAARAPARRVEAGAVAEEKALLKAARHARDLGAYDVALVNLAAHERRFPDGSLAVERERLRREVLAVTAAAAP